MPSFRVALENLGQISSNFTSKLRASQAKNKPKSAEHSHQSSLEGRPVTKNDYSWCLLSGGFMSHWTKHYFDENENNFHRSVWRFFSIFKLLIIIRIVRILSLYGTPNYAQLRVHVHLGTFARYMGGPLHFTELIAFFWSLSEAMMYQFCINPPRHQFDDWIGIFLFLNQSNIKSIALYFKLVSLFLNSTFICRSTNNNWWDGHWAWLEEHQQVEESSKDFLHHVGAVHFSDNIRLSDNHYTALLL